MPLTALSKPRYKYKTRETRFFRTPQNKISGLSNCKWRWNRPIGLNDSDIVCDIQCTLTINRWMYFTEDAFLAELFQVKM